MLLIRRLPLKNILGMYAYKVVLQTCVKQPLNNRQNKDLMTNGNLMKVKSIAECSNIFYLH